MRRAVVVAIVGGLALITRLLAQQPLTLAQAQAEARAHAPGIAERQASVQGAAAIAAQAGRRFRENPNVSGSYFNGSLIGRPDEMSWNLGASLSLDVSRSWKPRAASAAADLARTRSEELDGLRALDEQVAVVFADVAFEQRLVVRGQRIADLQAIAAAGAHRQLDVGQGTLLDADSADLDLASARAALEQARGELAGVRTRFARLLGREIAGDLVVEDPPEPAPPLARPDFDAVVDRDPRMRAALAEIDAATFERRMFERLVIPQPTLGVDFGYQRREIPAGSFAGPPLASTLTANWPDRDLVFNVSIPLPFFDRQQEPRARATGRLLTAQAKARAQRLTVRTELESAWSALDAAGRAVQAAANMTGLIDRDVGFVEQAVRAGAFDTLTRTQALRRLVDAGRLADATVHDYRVARAAWVRRTLGLP